jgi:hypothetical protein
MLVNHINNAHNAAAAKVLLLLTACAYLLGNGIGGIDEDHALLFFALDSTQRRNSFLIQAYSLPARRSYPPVQPFPPAWDFDALSLLGIALHHMVCIVTHFCQPLAAGHLRKSSGNQQKSVQRTLEMHW